MSRDQMHIIGLCGAAGAGKDEAANALVANGWRRIAFADPVRVGLLALNPNVDMHGMVPRWIRWMFGRRIMPLCDAVAKYGWDEVKRSPEVRGLLQRYGTEAGRDIHGDDCWVKIARRRINNLRQSFGCKHLVLTDVRFRNEVALIRSYGGAIVRITRPSRRILCCTNARHRSESQLTPDDHDFEIVNDATPAELWRVIRDFAWRFTSDTTASDTAANEKGGCHCDNRPPDREFID